MPGGGSAYLDRAVLLVSVLQDHGVLPLQVLLLAGLDLRSEGGILALEVLQIGGRRRGHSQQLSLCKIFLGNGQPKLLAQLLDHGGGGQQVPGDHLPEPGAVMADTVDPGTQKRPTQPACLARQVRRSPFYERKQKHREVDEPIPGHPARAREAQMPRAEPTGLGWGEMSPSLSPLSAPPPAGKGFPLSALIIFRSRWPYSPPRTNPRPTREWPRQAGRRGCAPQSSFPPRQRVRGTEPHVSAVRGLSSHHHPHQGERTPPSLPPQPPLFKNTFSRHSCGSG